MTYTMFSYPPRDERYDKAVKETLIADSSIKQLFQKLDSDPKLVGAGVVFVDKNSHAIQLRPFQASCRIKPIHIVLHEIPSHEPPMSYATKLQSNERESRAVVESVSVLLSCGAAVLGWLVVTGSAGAAPITGGGSTAITVLSYGAAYASTIQCGVGLVRTYNELTGGEHNNDWLDSQEWYNETMRALDIISLAGAATAGIMSFKAYQVAKTATGKSLKQTLRGMSRAERKRLTEEIIRVNHPGVSNTALKRMIRSGLYPKRYSSNTINTSLMLHVKDAVGATFSFSGSFTSGVLRNIAVGVYEEVK